MAPRRPSRTEVTFLPFSRVLCCILYQNVTITHYLDWLLLLLPETVLEGLGSSCPGRFEFSVLGFYRNGIDDLGNESPALWPTQWASFTSSRIVCKQKGWKANSKDHSACLNMQESGWPLENWSGSCLSKNRSNRPGFRATYVVPRTIWDSILRPEDPVLTESLTSGFLAMPGAIAHSILRPEDPILTELQSSFRACHAVSSPAGACRWIFWKPLFLAKTLNAQLLPPPHLENDPLPKTVD